MTYLELVVRFCDETGVNAAGLTTVANQTGELKRMAKWIADAWVRIQGKHQEWRFLRTTASWATVDGQAAYTTAQCGIPAGHFGRWLPESFRNVIGTATTMAWGDAWGDAPFDGSSSNFGSEIFMDALPYADWRDVWNFGATRSVKSRPIQFAIAPNDGIVLGPAPLAGYTILGDYYAAPVRLTLDADQPALPPKHDDMIIVYYAMMSYGAFWGAPEVYGQGKTEYTKLMTALEADQLPIPFFCGALA